MDNRCQFIEKRIIGVDNRCQFVVSRKMNRHRLPLSKNEPTPTPPRHRLPLDTDSLSDSLSTPTPSLDGSQNGPQMCVALHRESLESSLIQMSVTHGPMHDPPGHRMRVPQPTEESRDLAVGLRPDNKVPTPARRVLFALLLRWAGNLARKQWPLSILAASPFPSPLLQQRIREWAG